VNSSLNYGRVLVTGGAGFIGSHLVEGLVKEGFEVIVLDNLSTGRMENLRHLDDAKVRFVEGDIRDGTVAKEASKDVEVVFHLAAIASVPYSIENPVITHDVNVNGTRTLLEASLRNRVGRFIYVSTCAVYGEPEYLPIDENHPVNPISPYGVTKLEAERFCKEFYKTYGLEITILRPFNVYGLRQRNDQYSGVIARFIERLSNGQPPTIYGNGTQTRDFIHVKDAVEAFMLTLSSKDAVNETFNIATGVPTSTNQMAQLLIELFGAKDVNPQYLGARPGDINHIYADVKKAKSHLRFEPRVHLKEGLSTLIRQLKRSETYPTA